MPRLSRPVTAQRARLYLRCFFTGTGQAAVSSRRTWPACRCAVQRKHGAGAISAKFCASGARRPASMRAHSLSPTELFFGLVAAGTEIENLRVAGIEAQRARRLGAARPRT